MKQTTIRLSPSTKNVLKELGSKGESYEDIILKYLPVRASYGTDDSYTTSYPYRSIEDIIEYIKYKGFNAYHGGECGSTSATIKTSKQGYVFHDNIILQFASIKQCRAFEERIKHLFDEDMFTQRTYP